MHPTAPDLRRVYADAPHGQIHYYDSGSEAADGRPPLLLLHQSPSSTADWFAVVPHLRRAGLRVIGMDTPGMGLSDPLPSPPALSDYVRAAEIVLDHARVKRADLLGHHTGVQIAVEAAVHMPDRVRAVALYGAPVMTAEERRDYWTRIVPREQEGAIHKPVKGAAHLTDYFNRVEGLFGPVAAQRLLLGGLIAGPLWWHGHNAALLHDMAPALTAMTQPILLITHPSELLERNTQEALRLRPDATFVSLPIDAPMAMDADPAALADTVLAFLDRIDRREDTA